MSTDDKGTQDASCNRNDSHTDLSGDMRRFGRNAFHLMGANMIYSGSIYFFGNYRPAHFEASSLKALRAQMLAAIKQMNMDDWQFFAWRIDDLAKQLRKNYASLSADYGARGVAMRKRPHDPFLDSVTRELPEYPGLAYA